MATSRPGQEKHLPPGRAFVKGQSGNPGGLPAEVKRCRELALKHAPWALGRLRELAEQEEDVSVAERATEALLDRAGLKAFAMEPDKLEIVNHDAGDALGRLSALVARRLAVGAAVVLPPGVDPKPKP